MSTIWLRPFTSTGYWKQRGMALCRSYVATLGTVWLFVKVMSEFNIPTAHLTPSWLLLGLPLVVAIWSKRPIPFVRHKLRGQDVTVELRVGDIFKLGGAKVISTNTTFETDLDGVISLGSLQGKFTKKLYDSIDHLDRDLEKALEGVETLGAPRRGRTEWPIGTVARLNPQGNTVYMVAVAQLNDHGVAQGTKEDVFRSLGMLWHFIGEEGEHEPVCIPILGTGRARVTVPREEMVKEIVRSFVAACGERKFTELLTVVISPNDYIKHQMDLDELGRYVKHVCENASFSLAAAGHSANETPDAAK